MKKELLIFIIVFIVLALIQHPDLLSSPLTRLSELPTAGAYGLGAVHPLVFALVGYLLLWIVRLVIRGVKKLFGSKAA